MALAVSLIAIAAVWSGWFKLTWPEREHLPAVVGTSMSASWIYQQQERR